MALVPVYNTDDGSTWSINITLESGVLSGQGGGERFYIKTATSKKDPDGNEISDRLILDIPSGINTHINAAVETILQYANGTEQSSSSSTAAEANSSSTSEAHNLTSSSSSNSSSLSSGLSSSSLSSASSLSS